jgi:chromosome segregation ATPase
MLKTKIPETESDDNLLRIAISSVKDNLCLAENEIQEQMTSLVSEIEHLHAEKKILNKDIAKYEDLLTETRDFLHKLIDSVDKRKQSLHVYQSENRSIISEIDFYTSEKAKLSEALLVHSNNLNNEVESLEDIYQNILFVKGEIQIMLDKLIFLEADIPDKLNDIKRIDDLFGMTLNELRSLYVKASHTAKQLKSAYYKKGNSQKSDIK